MTIIMEDGSFKLIEHVQLGEMVTTLQGSRAVLDIKKSCHSRVVATTMFGSEVVHADRKLLCPLDWSSPNDFRFGKSLWDFEATLYTRNGLREGLVAVNPIRSGFMTDIVVDGGHYITGNGLVVQDCEGLGMMVS